MRKIAWRLSWEVLSGGLFFLLAYNLYPRVSNVIEFCPAARASPLCWQLLTAVAAYAPNHPINLLFMDRSG
jgi:hypothetical protein